jgi:hypothetical protein
MEPHAIPLIFVQINDVYFIDARADYSKPDGLLLPRVSSVVKRLRDRFGKQVVFVLPGDFLAPSCMSKLFCGRQMISVLNSMGLDYATFGNHEFESIFTPETLAKLIRRSDEWLLSEREGKDARRLNAQAGPLVGSELFMTKPANVLDHTGDRNTRIPQHSNAKRGSAAS